jgi:hypothetical protein
VTILHLERMAVAIAKFIALRSNGDSRRKGGEECGRQNGSAHCSQCPANSIPDIGAIQTAYERGASAGSAEPILRDDRLKNRLMPHCGNAVLWHIPAVVRRIVDGRTAMVPLTFHARSNAPFCKTSTPGNVEGRGTVKTLRCCVLKWLRERMIDPAKVAQTKSTLDPSGSPSPKRWHQ